MTNAKFRSTGTFSCTQYTSTVLILQDIQRTYEFVVSYLDQRDAHVTNLQSNFKV